MKFLRIFQHILPNARAWRITIDKNLRRFFQGLTGIGNDLEIFFQNIYLDLFPQTTRELQKWEQQFALRNTNLTEQERRDRLDAAWKATGGQDPRYIQDTLQGAGFDVYVHEWWEPGTEPPTGVKQCVTPRNPLTVIRPSNTGADPRVDCGEPLAECGEAFAECGNGLELVGYPLVNKVFQTTQAFIILCGEAIAECGEPLAECGNSTGFIRVPRQYIVPNDPAKWPYFLYIGGVNFGDIASLPVTRRDEFERLCLKICPTQQWIGVLVQYT